MTSRALASAAREFEKLAAESSKAKEVLRHFGAGLLGFGAGTAAGAGAAELAARAYKGRTGSAPPRELLLAAMPLLGTGAGVAYSMYKSRESEAIRRALEDPPDAARRG